MHKVFAHTVLFLILGIARLWCCAHGEFDEKITFSKSAVISALETDTTLCIDDTDYSVVVTHANQGTLALWHLLPGETSLTFFALDELWVYYFGPIVTTANPDDLVTSVAICLSPLAQAFPSVDTDDEASDSPCSSFSHSESDTE